ncbi:MAG: PQQ-binding-like beta-propeller repeat protein [Candidatus Methanoperedens sp.]|nr:PQQ-binding-like beta-propeller repeat protein [Candidatus Methanoperedens sp.]
MFLSGNIRCCSIRIAACIIVLFFLLTGSAGAALVEEWNRTYAGAGNTSATAVWQTSDGGYIFAGAACYNQWCMPWLVRTDAHGNEQWNRTFRDIYGAKSAQQTMDGGYILAGRKLIKTDMNGNEEWNRTFNGMFNSVQQTTDGGYIGAGAIDTGMGDYHPDGWLIKTDENGNEQWNRTFRGHGFGYINSVEHTSDGGFVLAGHRRSTPDSEGGAWLIKVDAPGNELWNRTFGEWNTTFEGRGEEAYSVLQTKDGGYILAGFGFLLIKTDANGNMQWGMNRTFKGKDTAAAQSVQLMEDGGYIMTVEAHLYGGRSNIDSWLIKVNETGNELWNMTLGREQNSEARSVQRAIDGGYIVAGMTYSSAGGSYAWLIKVSGESTGTPASSPTETPIATLTVTPPEKAAGFEAVLAITMLLTLYKTGKRRIK